MSMASIETMGSTKGGDMDVPPKKLVNTNLISLKCLLFLFFGGMGCLLPFLPLHMKAVGLTLEEVQLVSIVSPLVALLGPIIAGPLADKIAGRQGANEKPSNGRYLRVMIALACFFSAVFYALLLLVPIVERIELPRERAPTLKFSCDNDGATVLQERNQDFSLCYDWDSESRVCGILLRNCNYVCKPIGQRRVQFSPNGETDATNAETTDGYESSGDLGVIPLESDHEDHPESGTKTSRTNSRKPRHLVNLEPPHLCIPDGNGSRVCHVYTSHSGSIPVNASFRRAKYTRDRREWCEYPISEHIRCNVPGALRESGAERNESCSVECDLLDPFMQPGSAHAENQCHQVAGQPDLTFGMYLIIRSIADIFPTAAIALVDTAIVIATRETSCGRGDVGRQLAFGSLGFAGFGPFAGYLNSLAPSRPAYFIPIALHVCVMCLAAITALAANGMPLSPPEWWWHTRSGMLAVPMSAVKRYGSETVALSFVLLLLGVFWSAIDSYLPLLLADLSADGLTIGVIVTVGAIPTVFFLWRSEHFVDYCGHSNLLILAFTFYILRFTGLSLVTEPWWALIAEFLEFFTLGIMWVTGILYMRHLVPRNLTATAQALPVIAHFCLGRCLGALVGSYVHSDATDTDSLKFVYQRMALAAAVVAVLYFVLYHGLLKSRFHAQTVQGSGAPTSVVQGMNGNGNYTPLRVYHNGMGKKGQFRY